MEALNNIINRFKDHFSQEEKMEFVKYFYDNLAGVHPALVNLMENKLEVNESV